MRKVAFIILFNCIAAASIAQLNYLELSNKKDIYFGISLGVNYADFKYIPAEKSALTDSIRLVSSRFSPGFNLGIISNFEFHKYFDFRVIPSLTFSDKTLDFNSVEPPNHIPSIYLDVPFMVRYKSKPIKDFRLFVLGGGHYFYDLASNASRRNANGLITLKANDFAIEYGIGAQIYFKFFIFSPEFKVSNGIINLHTPNEALEYSRAIEKLNSRFFSISLNFEG